jgi:hypothetical protein
MTLKTEEDIFFIDHVFCIFKKELMKYVVLEYVHVSPLHYNYFIYMSSFGFRPNNTHLLAQQKPTQGHEL